MAKRRKKHDKSSPKPHADRAGMRQTAPSAAPPFGGAGFPPISPRELESILREALPWADAGRDPRAVEADRLLDEAMESASLRRRLELASKAIAVWPDCADAYVMLAEEASSLAEALPLYEQGVAAGERAMGAADFEECAGHFWGYLPTRPYMRARLGLAMALWDADRQTEALEHYRAMLALNPGDNQGIRYLLVAALMDLDRLDDAQQVLADYADDALPEFEYTRALVAFRRRGAAAHADKLLAAAVESNRFVPPFLLGDMPLPRDMPASVVMGGEDEAAVYAARCLPHWRNASGAAHLAAVACPAAVEQRGGACPADWMGEPPVALG